MDRRTIEYYEAAAPDLAARYRAANPGLSAVLQEAFPVKGSRILDVGAGSGRDVSQLLQLGYEAFGTEPSAAMRLEAETHFPDLRGRLFEDGLPLKDEAAAGGPYDGILCSAVLMHVPENAIFNALFSLKTLLKEGGRLLISISVGRGDIGEDHRQTGTGRLFNDLPVPYLTLLLERLGFVPKRQWQEVDGLGRPDLTWHNLLFELRRGDQIRPTDRIETVLNRDRKTATYKLALFRALCEIAAKEYNQVRWVSDTEVHIPLDLIAQKWLAYYWRLFEPDQFIPQNNGETEEARKPVKFRRALTDLVNHYRKLGGLPAFAVDLVSDRLTPEARLLHKEAITLIRAAIREGPVFFTSGQMFKYVRGGWVALHPDLWREFSTLGHWIEPAIMLRWAEESERMAKGSVRASMVLDCLLLPLEEERNVGEARVIYGAMPQKRCVWTDTSLQRGFDVDHVLPFSLWRNNELWNLLPCAAEVNRQKSDMLPTRDLLLGRRDAIVACWEFTRVKAQVRFTRELSKFAGRRGLDANWQKSAFDALVEAVEMTGATRGCSRWQP